MTTCPLTCDTWKDTQNLPYHSWASSLTKSCCDDRRYDAASSCPYSNHTCLGQDAVDCTLDSMKTYCSDPENKNKDVCKCYGIWKNSDQPWYPCLQACTDGYNPSNAHKESFWGGYGRDCCNDGRPRHQSDSGICFWFLIILFIIVVVCCCAYKCWCDGYIGKKTTG